jgi:hypothetical protein
LWLSAARKTLTEVVDFPKSLDERAIEIAILRQ